MMRPTVDTLFADTLFLLSLALGARCAQGSAVSSLASRLGIEQMMRARD